MEIHHWISGIFLSLFIIGCAHSAVPVQQNSFKDKGELFLSQFLHAQFRLVIIICYIHGFIIGYISK